MIANRGISSVIRIHQDVIRTIKSLGLNAKQARCGKRGGVKLKHQQKKHGINQGNLIHIKYDPIPPPTSLTNVCLKCSVSRNKVDVLIGYILEEELDITVLIETWLKDGDNAMTKDLAPDGFSIYSVNKKLKTGAVVAVIYRDALLFKPSDHKHFESFEYILSSISYNTKRLTLLVVYMPPITNSCPIGVFLMPSVNF